MPVLLLPAQVVTQRVGGCPRLRSLRLESCDGLRSVALRHSRVREVRLTGCKRLVSVALRCPLLSELDLDECGELQALRLRQVRRGGLGLQWQTARLDGCDGGMRACWAAPWCLLRGTLPSCAWWTMAAVFVL
jgi:hypothetical protein